MTELRNMCNRVVAASPWKMPPRRFALERLNDTTNGTSRASNGESWEIFVQRVDLQHPENLRSKYMRRFLSEVWLHQGHHQELALALSIAAKKRKPSYLRAIIISYFRYFSAQDPLMVELAKFCSHMAKHLRDDIWAKRGELWQLWDVQRGPINFAKSLLATDEPARFLRDSGFEGELGDSLFLQAVLRAACIASATVKVEEAETTGNQLQSLFAALPGAGEVNGLLAYALLAPWLETKPPETYQRALIAFLVGRLSDPRLQSAPWVTAITEVRQFLPNAHAEEAFVVLRRWLVQSTVRQFFSIVAKTTGNEQQWKDRTAFWLSYLDAGLIQDAWFAFGPQAEQVARRFAQEANVAYGRIERGGGATPQSSSLVLSIGDIRIAEWSHDGACRFWPARNEDAPALYKRNYDPDQLRAMHGKTGFDRLSHAGGWQAKFAGKIYKLTGLRHPKYEMGQA